MKKTLTRAMLAVGILATVVLGAQRVTGNERAAACPGSRCPTLNRMHGGLAPLGAHPHRRGVAQGETRRDPDGATPRGTCPYGGRSAVQDIDRV